LGLKRPPCEGKKKLNNVEKKKKLTGGGGAISAILALLHIKVRYETLGLAVATRVASHFIAIVRQGLDKSNCSMTRDNDFIVCLHFEKRGH